MYVCNMYVSAILPCALGNSFEDHELAPTDRKLRSSRVTVATVARVGAVTATSVSGSGGYDWLVIRNHRLHQRHKHVNTRRILR